MPKHVVILEPPEYERLQASEAIANRVLLHLTPAADRRSMETVAQAFMEQFEPERAHEWGHVSFCFGVALERLVRP